MEKKFKADEYYDLEGLIQEVCMSIQLRGVKGLDYKVLGCLVKCSSESKQKVFFKTYKEHDIKSYNKSKGKNGK